MSVQRSLEVLRASVRSRAERRAVRPALTLAGLAMALGTLPGCQNITTSAPVSLVRIIDASPDAGGLDVYQGGSALAYNLGLGTLTSYVQLSPGQYNIATDRAGTRTLVVSATGTFADGGQYTVLLGNYATSLQEVILKDQSQAAPSGQVAVRLIDQSTRAGAVDIYLVPSGSTVVSVRPILTGVTFNTNTGYVNFPSGTYTLVVLPAGTVPTASGTTAYSGAALSYSAGAAKTIVLIDQQLLTTSGLQVVVANDYDPAGATS